MHILKLGRFKIYPTDNFFKIVMLFINVTIRQQSVHNKNFLIAGSLCIFIDTLRAINPEWFMGVKFKGYLTLLVISALVFMYICFFIIFFSFYLVTRSKAVQIKSEDVLIINNDQILEQIKFKDILSILIERYSIVLDYKSKNKTKVLTIYNLSEPVKTAFVELKKCIQK